jgi:hypothetical protein
MCAVFLSVVYLLGEIMLTKRRSRDEFFFYQFRSHFLSLSNFVTGTHIRFCALETWIEFFFFCKIIFAI